MYKILNSVWHDLLHCYESIKIVFFSSKNTIFFAANLRRRWQKRQVLVEVNEDFTLFWRHISRVKTTTLNVNMFTMLPSTVLSVFWKIYCIYSKPYWYQHMFVKFTQKFSSWSALHVNCVTVKFIDSTIVDEKGYPRRTEITTLIYKVH